MEAQLSQAVDRLLVKVAHWQPGRWAAAPDRGDRVYALVQRLADQAAAVEHGPRRPVPRLADPVLPDQLRVMAHDLVAVGASADVLHHAAQDVDAVRRTL